jgi:hypothetical protein
MADMAAGRLDIPEGTGHLEAVRWLRRGAAHIARIFAHLRALDPAGPYTTSGHSRRSQNQ